MKLTLTTILAIITLEAVTASDIKDRSDLQQINEQAAQFIAERTTQANTDIGLRSQSVDDPSGFVIISDVIDDVIIEPRYFSTYKIQN